MDDILKNEILLVEDDQTLASLLLLELEQAGFKTTLAHDGWEALDKVNQQTFDGIITDLVMPNMDGLQLVHALSAMAIDIPIIIISGAASPDVQVILKTYHIKHIFIKPLLDEQLSSIFAILGKGISPT